MNYDTNTLIDGNIFNRVIQNDRSYLYRSKARDALNSSVYIHTFTIDDIQKSLKSFSRAYGEINTGERISITTNEGTNFFKLPTDILLPKKYRDGQLRDLIELLNIEVRAILLFINGKKIPSKVTKVFSSIYGLDIFIPYEYVDLNSPMEVFAEIINFRDREFIYYHNKNQQTSNISININDSNDNYFDPKLFDKNNILIYVDGVLSTEIAESTINTANNTINITSSVFLKKEVEIFYDPFIYYRKTLIKDISNNIGYFKIDKSFETSITGAIPKRNCGFYFNGLRIPPTKINQLSRQIYSYDFNSDQNKLEADNVLQFYVQDANKSNNLLYLNYNSDYYLNGMIGNDRILKKFKENISDSIFDKFPNEINFNKILNKNSTLYDEVAADAYIEHINNDESEINYEKKIIELIERNPSSTRDILKNFSRKVSSYFAKVKESDIDDIRISTKLTFIENKTIKVSVYINWEYVDISEYKIIDQVDTKLLLLPRTLFKTGNNYIEVHESYDNQNNIQYLEFEPSSIENTIDPDYQGVLVLQKSVIHEYTNNINHLIVLEKSNNENGLIYPTNDKVGYKYIGNYIQIDETETTYRFNFIKKPTSTFLIYFRNFSYNGKITYESTETNAEEALVYIYHDASNIPLPIIPLGLPEIYVNNKYMIYGIDFVFSTPMDNDALCGTVISFIRVLKNNDIISYSFDGIDNKGIINASNLKYNSKYGLLYLSALEFPFDHNYLDLFVNGYKVFKSDIDILSDKLIRVRNLPVPFYDVFVQTKFNVDYENLRFLYDAYKEDDFELLIAKLFSAVDPSKMQQDPNLPTPDEIYEDFENCVGENPNCDKTPNPDNPEEPPVRQDMLTAMFMKWLLSDDSRALIDQNHYVSSKVHGYFKLYQYESVDGSDIWIDMYDAIIVSDRDLFLDCNQKPYTTSEKLQYIINAVKKAGNGPIDFNQLPTLFINNKISNIIMPLDFPQMDNTGRYIGTFNRNVFFFEENENKNFIYKEKEKFDKTTSLRFIPDSICMNTNSEYRAKIYTNADNIELLNDENLSITYNKENNELIIISNETELNLSKIEIIAKKDGYNDANRILLISVKNLN